MTEAPVKLTLEMEQPENLHHIDHGNKSLTNSTTDPPPSCKKCFTKFAERKSMVCPHEFCSACWETMVDLSDPANSGGKKNKSKKDAGEESRENESVFTCAVCGASNRSTRPKSAYPVKKLETLGKDVKKIKNFKIILKRDKLFPDAMTWSPSGDFVAVNRSSKEILVLSPDGKVRKHFPYLRNHAFQGGLIVDKEGLIRVALKNDRFSGISYYTPEGQFKYSAFLYDETPNVGDIVSLDMDDYGNMVVLDKECGNICYVGQSKRVEIHPIVFDGPKSSDADPSHPNESDSQQKSDQPAGAAVKEAKGDNDAANATEGTEGTEDKPDTVAEAAGGEEADKSAENQEQEGNVTRDTPPASTKVACSKGGLTCIAVNSWQQVLVCNQTSSAIYTNEKHEHYDREVGRVDLSPKVQPHAGSEGHVLKCIVDEHDNILLLDKSTNRVLRYSSSGEYLDMLVQFPTTSSGEEDIVDDIGDDLDDDKEDVVRYSVIDVSCNMKGVLCIMYVREKISQGLASEEVNPESDNNNNMRRRTEISLYSYSTPRKQRRKERKDIKTKETPKDKAQTKEGNPKSSCCVIA